MEGKMMAEIVVVTGGARSGKSGYSESLAKNLGEKILYIATAIPFDGEMQNRIAKHQQTRPRKWETYEGYEDLHKKVFSDGEKYDGILIDCITVMITNIMFGHGDFDENSISLAVMDDIEIHIKKQLSTLIEVAKDVNVPLIMVTNEVGSGIVPETKMGRVFRDLAGRVNQFIAQQADSVYLLVSGIPVKVK